MAMDILIKTKKKGSRGKWQLRPRRFICKYFKGFSSLY